MNGKEPDEEVGREWLTIEQMVAEFPWSPGTLYGWRHRHIGPPSVRPGRRVLYRRTDVEQWLVQQAAIERAAWAI
jgi:hypothetical protein